MTSAPTEPARVSTLELFFDLVFVFTITQVSAIVVESPTGVGVARAAATLSVIFFMYGGYAWVTNSNAPDSPARRGVLLAAMAAFFVCSLAVPNAFGTAGLAFAIAYLAIVLMHVSSFLIFLGRVAIAPMARLLPWNLLSAGLLLAAAWTHGNADWPLWLAAVAVQFGTPFLVGVGENFRINAAHFGERHGLVILIVLGESLVSVGLAGAHAQINARLVLGVLTGLLAASAMWWMYFAADDDRAAEALARAPAHLRPIWAVTGYYMAHLLMLLGILLLAAGARLPMGDLLAAASPASAWLIACGAGLYSFGSGAFRLALRFAAPVPRMIGGLVCLAAVPVGRHGSPAAELAAVAAILAATLLVETWRERRPLASAVGRSEKMTA